MSSYDCVVAAVKIVKEVLKDSPNWKFPKNAPTPMNTAYAPEMDGSNKLGQKDHTSFQELIGMP